MWGFDFRAFFPPFSMASFHLLTEEGAAPMVLATSRIPRPLANIPAAIRRLASNFFALPFGLIPPFIGSGGMTLEGGAVEYSENPSMRVSVGEFPTASGETSEDSKLVLRLFEGRPVHYKTSNSPIF